MEAYPAYPSKSKTAQQQARENSIGNQGMESLTLYPLWTAPKEKPRLAFWFVWGIHLYIWKSYRGREEEIEIFHWLDNSPGSHKKSRSQGPNLSPHKGDRDPNDRAIPNVLPRSLKGSWFGSRAARIGSDAHMERQHCRQWPYPLHHSTSPGPTDFDQTCKNSLLRSARLTPAWVDFYIWWEVWISFHSSM